MSEAGAALAEMTRASEDSMLQMKSTTNKKIEQRHSECNE
jgi:hypothetical protein